jgi:hypothetical protein
MKQSRFSEEQIIGILKCSPLFQGGPFEVKI